MVLSVLLLLVVGSAGSLTGAYIYAILLGVGYSATAALMPAMMSDRFEGDNFGSIFGTAVFGSAIGAAFGPWMGGFLFDVFGSYIIPFSIAAVCGIIAAVSGWSARNLRIRNS
jgi:MFS family permease